MIGATCIAAVNSSHDELMASSSGGAFSLIAHAVLSRGGVVYGHAFVSPTKVECIRIEEAADLPRLRGSKYVQSNMAMTMRDVLADLGDGREVLFSGTPCQVAGLKAFLAAKSAEADRLLLVDIVCHGVPSPEFYADCLRWESRGSRLEEVRFRDKREGWGCGGGTTTTTTPILCRLVTRNRAFTPKTSFYYKHFLEGDVYRESCYRCPYASCSRPGDVTLGDFWGVDHKAAGLSPLGGISLVIANTPKGEAAIWAVKRASKWAERPLEEAIAGNEQLRHPILRTAARDRILEDWKNRGIETLEMEYRRATTWERCAWLVKRGIKKLSRGVMSR